MALTRKHIGSRYGSQHIVRNRDAGALVVHLSDRGYTSTAIANRLQEKFNLLRAPARSTIRRILRRWGELQSSGRWRFKDA